MSAERLLSPHQVARALGVSESSLKRWCDRGLIPFERTAGGHRRLRADDVLAFLQGQGRGRRLADPALLGLPPSTGHSPIVLERALEPFVCALIDGNERACGELVLDLFLAGFRVSQIVDEVMAAAMREIGCQWECGRIEVYRERRAVETCHSVLHLLESLLPQPALDAPKAIGGTLSDDPYTLPTRMVDLVLRQAGWRSQSLGIALPAATFAAAIAELQPQLVWLSASHVMEEENFLVEQGELQHAAHQHQAVLVVGGRALNHSLRQRMRYAAFGDNLQHLEAFLDVFDTRVRFVELEENAGAPRHGRSAQAAADAAKAPQEEPN